MILETLPVGPLQVNCYILGCEQTRRAAVIDPGEEGPRIVATLQRLGLEADLVINTHGHFDHIGANGHVVEATGAELLIHQDELPLLRGAAEHAAMYGLAASASPEPHRLLHGGEQLQIGDLQLQVIHTPGHSPGGICLLTEDTLFSGDALFAGSIGRTDLPGGSQEQLVRGIREKLLTLPPETSVYPGHGPATTIAREQAGNPFLHLR